MITRYTYLLLLAVATFFQASCKKYLDAKSNQALSVPDNLEDLERLLNNVFEINRFTGAGNSGADEYYVKASDWVTVDEFSKDTYIWKKDVQVHWDWTIQYKCIFIANTVLDNLAVIDPAKEPQRWNSVKGFAHFVRGNSLFQLAQIVAPQYIGNQGSPLGLPIRNNSDFNEAVTRATLQQTYDQIIEDINISLRLSPEISNYKTQPSQKAAYALLARLYLFMGNYQMAYDYSDSCLRISNTLLDYNTLDDASEYPFPLFNDEVIYHTVTDASLNAAYWVAKVDSNLFRSFHPDDLRRKLFFKINTDGTQAFKGNYTGSFFLFCGLANDEMFLTRAEAAIRTGQVAQALEDLNTLLQKRWMTGRYTRITVTDPDELLALILQERRKELMNRGIRWSDLRRLNLDPRFQTTLKRVINGTEYTLPPNDLRYVFLVPDRTISMTGMQQNPR